MNLAIVHLTDLHVQSDTDRVLERGHAIVAAIRSRVIQADAIIVAVTGDLSYSGKESELLDASGLLDEVATTLETTTDATICVAIIPGNHDCDFSVTGDLRRLLLKGIEPGEEVADEPLSLLTKPLDQFFSIRDEFFPPTNISSPLTWSYEVPLGDSSVLVRCLNTAWCSSLHDEQGKLFFPTTRAPADCPNGHDLVITMLHHPTPWMEAQNGLLLRDYLDGTSDLVLTGHDHVASHRFVSKPTGQNLQYIAGVALEDSAGGRLAGFNLITIDIAAKRQRLWTFSWDSRDRVYSPRESSPPNTDLQVNRARKKKEFTITDQFQNFLDDLGLEVTHPTAGILARRQVFRYPQLRRIRFREQKGELLGAERLMSGSLERRLVLITGDEESGKTTLAKQLFEDLVATGLVPVYLRANRRHQSKYRSADRIDALITEAVSEQYGSESAERYWQLDTDQRVIIVDDYDKAAVSAEAARAIQSHLCACFDHVYLLSDAMSHELRRLEVGGVATLEDRKDAIHYVIQPFGFQRRNGLVEQWMALNPDLAADVGELVRQTESRNRILDTVIGKNLVPAFPVYILGVLQASDSVDAVDLRASVNAHYYELFIKNALAAKSDSIEYSVKTSFLAFLAYRMLESDGTRMEVSKCRGVYNDFQSDYALTIEYDAVMSALKRSRLLLEYDGQVEFKYEYCFYYFSALYLTKNLERGTIRARIQRLAEGIYEEQNANIFLFLAHLSENSFVLDQMLRCADGMFQDMPMATLTNDIAFLGENAEDLLGPAFWDVGDIRELREIALAKRDEEASGNHGAMMSVDRLDDYAAIQEHIRQLGAAFKTLQILGQVLKNFPAAIRSERKEEIATAAYGVALRALSDMLMLFERNQGDIVVAFMQRHMEEGEAAGYTEAFELARASVGGLTRLVAYGAVRRIVASLGGSSLPSPSPSVRKVADAIATPVSKLTVFGMELDDARRFPEGRLKELHQELKDNGVTCSVLQFLVVRHMHLFDVPYKAREKACAVLGIPYKRLHVGSLDPRRKLIRGGAT